MMKILFQKIFAHIFEEDILSEEFFHSSGFQLAVSREYQDELHQNNHLWYQIQTIKLGGVCSLIP